MSYEPIQCHIFDYIEIACMRGYTLDIELKTGKCIQGKAKTTKILNKEEFLVITTPEYQSDIRLDKIYTISVLDDNAKFKTIKIY